MHTPSDPDKSHLRQLPSVERLLQSQIARQLITTFGRPLTLEATRLVLEEARANASQGQSIPDQDRLLQSIHDRLRAWTRPTLQAVINATGVILHTNLGRAPLSAEAIAAMSAVSAGYSNLEYDLDKGQRGSRLSHAENLLARLTGAEAALVVNNNAAAVLLILTALARRRKVVIARSQLVEIGGGFRLPEVMQQSGARLLEVGTTNRVHLYDYESAFQEGHPALVLRAHRSNFRIIGFTSEPSLEEISQLAHRYALPLVDDLGSGTLLDTARYGLGHEPMVQESLAQGADLVSFSGDKLLGGPQAGIIVGKAYLVEKLKKHPLARAIRADKLCLAALTATLLHYLKDEAVVKIPVWRMISTPAEKLQQRAKYWSERLGAGEVRPGQSTVGGGSLPEEVLPTFLLVLAVPRPEWFHKRLRAAEPPVIARVESDQVMLDPRSVLPEQDEVLIDTLKRLLADA